MRNIKFKGDPKTKLVDISTGLAAAIIEKMGRILPLGQEGEVSTLLVSHNFR